MSKRSFFQKLTGSYPFEEEEQLEVQKASNHKAHHSPKTPAPMAPSDEGELTVDVYQTPDAIIVQSMVAGVRPDDLEISITREMVTIKGSRYDAREVEENDYFYKELYWGTFSRTVMLPAEIDVENAEAVEKHGLVIITLPKINKERQTKLRVKSN